MVTIIKRECTSRMMYDSQTFSSFWTSQDERAFNSRRKHVRVTVLLSAVE